MSANPETAPPANTSHAERMGWIQKAAHIEGVLIGLRALERAMASSHQANDLGIDEGDHRDAVRSAAELMRRHGFAAPKMPDLRRPVSLLAADAYSNACKAAIWDPDTPAYWYWRLAERAPEAPAILRSALSAEGLAELGWVDDIITTGQHRRDRASAISYLDRFASFIGMFHRHWAIHEMPALDYSALAAEIMDTVADTLPERPAMPVGRVSYANLQGVIDRLNGCLVAVSVPGCSEQAGKAAELGDDVPHEEVDESGMVTNPSDLTVYRGASEVLGDSPDIAPTYKLLTRILTQHPEIRRHKPNKQRLVIHVGDWARFMKAERARDGNDLYVSPDEAAARMAAIPRKAGRQRTASGASALAPHLPANSEYSSG